MSGASIPTVIRAVGDTNVLTDPQILEAYRFDGANDVEAGTPLAVVRATSRLDVRRVLEWATSNRVAVVPRGAGTGLSGGATAVDGGIVLSLEKLTAIEIDPELRLAHVGAGAINEAVKLAAAKHGLWYPPDPSSFESSTIGGNIATNAGGLCCFKYGVTGDYVVAMDAVLADGRSVSLGRGLRKDVAGLSLLRLLVGSEGTLGVITGATLRLIAQPEQISTVVGVFPEVASATDAVVAVGAETNPSLLELMDNAAIVAVDDMTAMGLDRNAGALVIAQADASDGRAAAEAT